MRTILYVLFLWFPFFLPAQEKAEIRFDRRSYLGLSGGMAYGLLRDAGVSPLIYSGPLLLGQAQFLRETPQWEWFIEGGVAAGTYEAARSFLVESEVISSFHGAGALRKVWQNDRGKIQLWAGPQYSGFTNYRITPAFRNNSTVLESLNSLMLGAKIQWKADKTFQPAKFLIFRRRGGLRQFRASSQINLPLLHSAWRPGFAYLEDFTNDSDWLGSENLLAFGGFRMQARTDLWYYMRNGNAWRLGYLWDVQQTPGEFNKLQTAQHLTYAGLMVKLN
ncbi:MAG: hypothetical protein IPH16_17710 [Haliscomenobacter sp.]|nr:hypothetical protein [Haliscomenobacter sp.]